MSALVAIVCIASGASFIVTAQVARSRAVVRRGATVRSAGGLAGLLPYFFWVPYVVIAVRPGPEITVPDGLVWIGLALAVGGVAFALWAIATLGRHYDLVLEVHSDHEVIRTGPFAIVRHPVYTGLALHFAGACLATGSVLLVAGTLLVTYPSFWLRAVTEERLLRAELGAAYGSYARDVPMLVPFPRP